MQTFIHSWAHLHKFTQVLNYVSEEEKLRKWGLLQCLAARIQSNVSFETAQNYTCMVFMFAKWYIGAKGSLEISEGKKKKNSKSWEEQVWRIVVDNDFWLTFELFHCARNRPSHESSHVIPTATRKYRILAHILQMRELKLREIKWLDQMCV